MIRSLLTAEITGADIPASLRSLTEQGITLLCTVFQNDLTVRVTLQLSNYGKFLKICEKRGDQVKILTHRGIYWMMRDILRRPLLLLGCLLLLFAVLYLPSRVLFVQVEGNRRLPDRQILEMADACGIGFGASRRAVRSEKMKNALLQAMPELQWAGVNTKGCVAVITVRERTIPEQLPASDGVSHIVALTDARIVSCTATRGNLLCAPGQAVKAGQILISGYTDTGLTIRAEGAEGEIYGQTRRSFRAVTPVFSGSTRRNGTQIKKYSLILGKKRINLWKDSGIWDATCDRMYEEYYITLPGGFRLPAALAVERYDDWDLTPREIAQAEAEALLSDFAEAQLMKSMIAGKISSMETSVSGEAGLWILAGEYRCVELIGIRQRLQNGE